MHKGLCIDHIKWHIAFVLQPSAWIDPSDNLAQLRAVPLLLGRDLLQERLLILMLFVLHNLLVGRSLEIWVSDFLV